MRRRFRKILQISTLALLGATSGSGWLVPAALGQEARVTAQAKEQPPAAAPSPPPSCWHLPQEAKAQPDIAPDFAFEGISFNTTVTEFKKDHPEAIIGPDTDKKTKVEEFYANSTAALVVDVNFYDGHLYYIRIIYDAKHINHIGGDTVVLDRLVHRYGQYDASSPGVTKEGPPQEFKFIWVRPGINTYIVLSGTKNSTTGEAGTILEVCNIAACRKVTEAQKHNSDTGF